MHKYLAESAFPCGNCGSTIARGDEFSVITNPSVTMDCCIPCATALLALSVKTGKNDRAIPYRAEETLNRKQIQEWAQKLATSNDMTLDEFMALSEEDTFKLGFERPGTG